MKNNKFCSTLKALVLQERKTGKTNTEIARSLGYNCPTALRGLLHGDFLPGREAFAVLCAHWPALSGTLDSESLRSYPRKNNSKKNGTKCASAPQPTTCPAISELQLGCMLSSFAHKPEAAQWVEVLEAAANHKISFSEVISVLKSGVQHG